MSESGQDWQEAFEEEHDARLQAEAELKRTEAKLQDLQTTAAEFQTKQDEWDAKYAKLQAKLTQASAAQASSGASKKEPKADLALSRQLTLERKKNNLLERQVDELEMQVKQRDTNHSAIVAGMKDKVELTNAATAAKKRAQDELKATKDQMLRLRSQVTDLEAATAAANERASKSEEARKATQRRVQVLQAWKDAVAAQGGKTREASEASEGLEAQIAELKDKLAQEAKTRTRLMNQNRKLEVANQEYNRALRDLEAEALASGSVPRSTSRLSRSASTPTTPRLSFTGKTPLPPTPKARPDAVPEQDEATSEPLVSARSKRLTSASTTGSRSMSAIRHNTPRSLPESSSMASMRDLTSVRALVDEERKAKMEANGRLESMRRKLDTESAARAKAEHLLQELRMDLTDLRGRHADLSKEKRSLSNELAASKRQLVSVQNEKAKLASLLTTLKDNHDLTDRELAQVRKAVPPGSIEDADELRASLTKVRERNVMLEQEVTMLRERIRASALKFGLTPSMSDSSINMSEPGSSGSSRPGSSTTPRTSAAPARSKYLQRRSQLASSSSARSITQARKMIVEDDKKHGSVSGTNRRVPQGMKQVVVPPGMSLPAVSSPASPSMTTQPRPPAEPPKSMTRSGSMSSGTSSTEKKTISSLSLEGLMSTMV